MSVRVLRGDCRAVMASMEPGQFHLTVTSPPFYGLRDYGTAPQVWLPPAHEAPCAPGAHEWTAIPSSRKRGHDAGETALCGNTQRRVCPTEMGHGTVCARCGAWSGELGQEPLHDCLAWARGEPPCAVCYVCHLRTVAGGKARPEGIWLLLRDDGVLLLNLGDSYSGNRGNTVEKPGIDNKHNRAVAPSTVHKQTGLSDKNLIGIPWRVGLALQSDGWILRNDLIWAKRNGMPESVRDRCTRSHEYVLHLVKQGRYFWDAEGLREEAAWERWGAQTTLKGRPQEHHAAIVKDRSKEDIQAQFGDSGKNARTVWWFATQPLKDAHYAPFPDELPERAILAATSEHGCCPTCGAAWERVVEREKHPTRDVEAERAISAARTGRTDGAVAGPSGQVDVTRTVGWRPTCQCPVLEPASCRVLDPFGGSGTTGVVANRLGRDATLIELKPDYADIAGRRLGREPLSLFASRGYEGLSAAVPADDAPETKQERHPNRTVLVFPPLVEAGNGAIGMATEGAAG